MEVRTIRCANWRYSENAKQALDAYKLKIGGTPPPEEEKPGKKKAAKGGKRSASAAFNDSPAVEASAKKKGRRATNGVDSEKALPEGSWEDHILSVMSIIEEEEAAKGGKGAKGKSTIDLFGLIHWNEGRKTKHPMRTLRRKCPQKLLDYYEQHL